MCIRSTTLIFLKALFSIFSSNVQMHQTKRYWWTLTKFAFPPITMYALLIQFKVIRRSDKKESKSHFTIIYAFSLTEKSKNSFSIFPSNWRTFFRIRLFYAIPKIPSWQLLATNWWHGSFLWQPYYISKSSTFKLKNIPM